MSNQSPLLDFPADGHFVSNRAADWLEQLDLPFLAFNAQDSPPDELGPDIELQVLRYSRLLDFSSIETGYSDQTTHQVDILELKFLVNLGQVAF